MLAKPTEETQIAEISATLPAYENPGDVVRRSGQWATALMEAVEDRKMYADMYGKKYLEVEAWQLVGMFANAHAVPQNPIPLEKDGEITGYECTAIVYQNGNIIGEGGWVQCLSYYSHLVDQFSKEIVLLAPFVAALRAF